jgi:hypothetical protein
MHILANSLNDSAEYDADPVSAGYPQSYPQVGRSYPQAVDNFWRSVPGEKR